MDPSLIFLRGVWKIIPDEEDTSWVQRVADGQTDKKGPCGDYGPIIKELLDKGIAPETIARLAKIIGYDVAFQLCYHLEDPSLSYEGFPDEEQIAWQLHQIDPDDETVISFMNGTYENLLGTDPTGRAMIPKWE